MSVPSQAWDALARRSFPAGWAASPESTERRGPGASPAPASSASWSWLWGPALPSAFLWCCRACLAARPWLRAESGTAASDVCRGGLSGMFLRCRRAGPGQAERVTWRGLPSPALRRALPTAARGCVMKCELPERRPPHSWLLPGAASHSPGPAVHRRRSIRHPRQPGWGEGVPPADALRWRWPGCE